MTANEIEGALTPIAFFAGRFMGAIVLGSLVLWLGRRLTKPRWSLRGWLRNFARFMFFLSIAVLFIHASLSALGVLSITSILESITSVAFWWVPAQGSGWRRTPAESPSVAQSEPSPAGTS